MANSVTQSQTLSTTIRDETKKSTTVKDIHLVTIGSDYRFLQNDSEQFSAAFVQLDEVGKTFGLFTATVSFESYFSPSTGGLRLSGSLSGKKLVSFSGSDTYAVFAVTDDGHIHGRGSQTALSANVSNWIVGYEEMGTSCHLGLGEQNDVTLNDFVDYTETYGWPRCRQVLVNYYASMYLTESGRMYAWGNQLYYASTYSFYSPSTISYISVSGLGQQKRVAGTPKAVTAQPGNLIGMSRGSSRSLVAWTKTKVYIQGYTSNANYGSNSSIIYHWYSLASYPDLLEMSNDNHNNGNTVESIRNKEIQQCVFLEWGYTTQLWILATDGTLHLRYSRYHKLTSSPYTDTDGYNGAFDPFVTNGGTGVFYCTQNTNYALNGRTFTKLERGYYHFAALASNGDLVTWGYGVNGQCGVNSTSGSYATVINANGSLAGKQVSDFVCIPYGTVIKDIDGGLHFCGKIDSYLVNIFGVPLNTQYLVPTAFPLKN